MTRFAAPSISVLVLLAGLSVVPLAHADEAGSALQDKMMQAYRDTKQYQSNVIVDVKEKTGRLSSTRSTDYKIAFSRDPSQIFIDRPEAIVVVDSGKVRAKSEQIAERYLEVTAPTPLNYDLLISKVPFLRSGQLPDLAALMSEDPMVQIAGEMVTSPEFVPPDAADAQARPGLRAKVADAVITLRLDAKTHMITQVIKNLKTDKPGDSVTVAYDIQIVKRNEALEGKPFEFDAGKLALAATFQDWVNRPAPSRPAPAEPEGLAEGKAAPDFTLSTLDGKKVKLSEIKESVVVLDFWATWCPPCRMALSKVASAYAWSKKEGKSVAFYAVDLQEAASDVDNFLKDQKIQIPVLLDADGDAARAYGATSIPMTVVISRGKIVKIHVGYSETIEDELKQAIQTALKADVPSTPPAPR